MQLLCVGITRYPRAVWDMETSIYPLVDKKNKYGRAAVWTDHRLDDQKYEFSSALWGTEKRVFFFNGRFAIHQTSLYSIRFNASVSYLTTRMIDCSLNRQSFCMNYAIFWAKLEVMVITLEPRTSNIAGSSRKYTNGFFICFDIRSTALSLLDMSQVGVIVFWIFIEDPYIFSHHSLAINDAMLARTVHDKCRLQCAACKCYTPARASVI